MSSYTIEYLEERADGPRYVVAPMFFPDKATALASALLRAGFLVSKVTGPGFEMGTTALKAYSVPPLHLG
jgi:hypothetical protein